MKLNLLLLSAILLAISSLNAQNLVPNPSFEEYKNIPCSWNVSVEEFSQYTTDWYIPTGTSTDILSTLAGRDCWANALDSDNTNSCRIGFQIPHSGDVIAGIFTTVKSHTWHEYLQVQLKEPLVPGQRYCIEMYVSAADFTSLTSNNLGMYFSVDPINGTDKIIAKPQVNYTEVISDTKGWTRVSGSFIADAPAQYLTIGNFFADQDTKVESNYSNYCNDGAYYFIDDIVVMACPI